MTSAQFLVKLADCLDNGLQATHTPPFVMGVDHLYYKYALKLEKQGYLQITQVGIASISIMLTVEGNEHVKEIRESKKEKDGDV